MTTFEIYELACRLYEHSEKASGKLDFVPLHRRCSTVITAWRNAAEKAANEPVIAGAS